MGNSGDLYVYIVDSDTLATAIQSKGVIVPQVRIIFFEGADEIHAQLFDMDDSPEYSRLPQGVKLRHFGYDFVEEVTEDDSGIIGYVLAKELPEIIATPDADGTIDQAAVQFLNNLPDDSVIIPFIGYD